MSPHYSCSAWTTTPSMFERERKEKKKSKTSKANVDPNSPWTHCQCMLPMLTKFDFESLGSMKSPRNPHTKANADARAKAGRLPLPKMLSQAPAPRATITCTDQTPPHSSGKLSAESCTYILHIPITIPFHDSNRYSYNKGLLLTWGATIEMFRTPIHSPA